MASGDDLRHLGDEQYILLTSYRRDGTAVPTPVWVAGDGDTLLVWTVADSGKVKRIRRDGAITVAPCTFRGAPTGSAVAARARVVERDEADYARRNERGRALIARKYGVFGRLTMLGSRLRRGRDGTVLLEIRPGNPNG